MAFIFSTLSCVLALLCSAEGRQLPHYGMTVERLIWKGTERGGSLANSQQESEALVVQLHRSEFCNNLSEFGHEFFPSQVLR